VYDCKYHVVFYPKYRKKVLVPPVSERLKELFKSKAKELQAEIAEMEIMPDHVHLLIQCDPQFGIHRVVKHLKGYTSRILRQEFPHLKSRLPSMDKFLLCGNYRNGIPGCSQAVYRVSTNKEQEVKNNAQSLQVSDLSDQRTGYTHEQDDGLLSFCFQSLFSEVE